MTSYYYGPSKWLDHVNDSDDKEGGSVGVCRCC